MRTAVLFALIVPFAGCATTESKVQPYAKPNSLMQREIAARIANFKFQHGQELLNNLMWLETKAGETAIPDLLAVLNDEDPKVRCSATWVLGRIRDRRTIPQLQQLTTDPNEVVRLEASRSLVMMGDLKHINTLIEGLDSDKAPVRYNCHMALRDGTKKDFQYDHLEEDIDRRRVAVLRWREWWSKQSQDPWFASKYARQHNLTPDAGQATPAMPAGETQPRSSNPVPQTQPQTQPQPEVQTRPETSQPKPGMQPKTQTQPEAVQPDANAGTKPGTQPETEAKPKGEGDAGAVFKLLDLESKSSDKTPGIEAKAAPKTEQPSKGMESRSSEGEEKDAPVFKPAESKTPAKTPAK